MTAPIVLAANSTSWDEERDELIPGGQGDRYLRPILDALPEGAAVIARQPRPGAVNACMNHREIYAPRCWYGEHASVQLSHGIASKGYRQPSNCSTFTYIAAPGPALADEIIQSGVAASRVKVLGYAKLDPIFRGEVESPWPERDGRVRVLWAPTHGGGSERFPSPQSPGAGATTWWRRDEVLGLLDPDQVLVMEAPHPRHSPGRQATLAQYVGADVVIADGGSTMYEAWCVGLPVVFADWISGERNLTRANGTLLESRVYREEIGWHARQRGQFARLVSEAAAAGISDVEREFAEQVLPSELRGRGGQLHAELLLELADAPRNAYQVVGACANVSVATASGGRARQTLFRRQLLPPEVPEQEIAHLLSVGLIEPAAVNPQPVQVEA